MNDIRHAWIRLPVLGCSVFLIALMSVPHLTGQAESGEPDGNVVTEWNAIAQNAIVTVGAQPIQRSQLWMTLVHVAIYDAVMSINGQYEQFEVTPAHLRPASRDAAAIAAAHGILVRLLPGQQASLDAARENSLSAIRDGARKNNGIAIGEEVASRLLEIHDGVIPTVTYIAGVGPGVWQPTPPAFANALLPGFAQVTPFALASASQFRPGPPPALSSSVWTRDYNEVKAFGAATGSLRTSEQTEIGRFYTEHAVAQYSRAFRRYAVENDLDVPKAARFFAMANTSILDSQIACWDAKFHYNFWRPVTAIRAGDTDGDPATAPDAGWIGLAVTPPHPEYPAAHGCWTSATARILELFNGTNMVHFALDSAVTGTTHVFERTEDLRAEIINARVYGGMHFRNSVEVGARIGEQVADWVAFCFRSKLGHIEEDDDDGTWIGLIVTPNHPDYPAAHGCFSGASTETLKYFFGTDAISFSITSNVAGVVNPVRTHSRFPNVLTGVLEARIYIGINDVLSPGFNPRAFTLFDAWRNLASSGRDPYTDAREAVARGQEVFNTRRFTIANVRGVNDALVVAALPGTCTTCHDTPNVGNHSTSLPQPRPDHRRCSDARHAALHVSKQDDRRSCADDGSRTGADHRQVEAHVGVQGADSAGLGRARPTSTTDSRRRWPTWSSSTTAASTSA